MRPAGYWDDLAGVFYALWLSLVHTDFDAYSGSAQAGGKHANVLMVIGIVVMLQVRGRIVFVVTVRKR